MSNSRVLIIGGTGLLGKALIDTCPISVDLSITYLRDCWQGVFRIPAYSLDVTNKEDLSRVFREARPTVVVHAGGMNSVDLAEQNQTIARLVNVDGTQNIIELCHQYHARMIYASSNAVYDGNHPPYSEDSIRLPVNYYGRLKVQAENLVMASGLDYIIVRAILMYGWHFPQSRPNWVTTWIRTLGERRPVLVVNDRYSQPLFAEDCAVVIWRAIERNRTDVYNVAGPDRLSLYEFAVQTAQVMELEEELIQPVASSYFSHIAPRPVDTSFTSLKVQAELGVLPRGVVTGLRYMKETRPLIGTGELQKGLYTL